MALKLGTVVAVENFGRGDACWKWCARRQTLHGADARAGGAPLGTNAAIGGPTAGPTADARLSPTSTAIYPALEAVVAADAGAGAAGFVNLGMAVGAAVAGGNRGLADGRDWVTLAGNHERRAAQPFRCRWASDRYALGQLSPRHLAWIAAQPADISCGPTSTCATVTRMTTCIT